MCLLAEALLIAANKVLLFWEVPFLFTVIITSLGDVCARLIAAPKCANVVDSQVLVI